MITILGSRGFVGRHLLAHLRRAGADVAAPERGAALPRRPGTVIDCTGVTGDFRTRPFDTVQAHVSALGELLRRDDLDGYVYLSSARVYRRSADTRESALLQVDPGSPDDLYDLSKLTGECFALRVCPEARVVRLSNVVGHNPEAGTFLPMIVRDAVSGRIRLAQGLDSAKDYVHIDDVVRALLRVGPRGQARTYNVASGRSITHRALVERLQQLTACHVEVAADAPIVVQPPIDVTRARRDLDLEPRCVLDALAGLVARAAQPLETS